MAAMAAVAGTTMATNTTRSLVTRVTPSMPTDDTSARRSLPLAHQRSGDTWTQSTGRREAVVRASGSASSHRCSLVLTTSLLGISSSSSTKWVRVSRPESRLMETRATVGDHHHHRRAGHVSLCRAMADDSEAKNDSPAATAELAVASDSEPDGKLVSAGESHAEPVAEPELGPFRPRDDVVTDIAVLTLAPLLRFGGGTFVNGYSYSVVPESEAPEGVYGLTIGGRKVLEKSKPGRLPEKPIVLYEFEGCPFCRKVREAVTILDLDVLFYPCPAGGPTFRPIAKALGGKAQFPYMVDPNTNVSMYESDEIIKYLFTTYGDGEVPTILRLGLLTTLTCGLAAAGIRGRKGSRYTPAKMPEKPLEVWGYESSMFSRLVREVLGELELPHILHSVGRGSPKRQAFYEKFGRFQAPYLEDPNTGFKRFESAYIVDYLRSTYALPATPSAAAASN